MIGILSVIAGVLVRLGTADAGNTAESIWWAFLRLTDPGYLGDDQGVFRRVVSTVLTDRIRVVLGAFHLITLTLLTGSAMGGYLRFKKRKFSKSLLILFVATALSVLGLRQLLSQSMKRIPSNLEVAESFQIISPQRDFVVMESSGRNPNPKWRGENTLSRIKRRSKIRVGFYTKSGPFTYFNKDSVLNALMM